jgi:hypothetical protein
MLISGKGAWALIDGVWTPVEWDDAARSGRVLAEEDFVAKFPDLPPWPEDFNRDGRPLGRGLKGLLEQRQPFRHAP